MNKSDYHIHSNHSDGSDTPAEIIEKVLKLGIQSIALTDHDTIGGLRAAQEVVKSTNIQFINGIELSVRYEKTRLIHILGLGLDIENVGFQEQYEIYRTNRELALEQVLKALNERGLHLTTAALVPFSFGEKLDRQSIAKWLIANGYAPNMQKAWNDYLDPIPYGDKELLEPEEAFKMIHLAKGKAYIAHIHKPIGMYGYSTSETIERMRALKEIGLDGIESRYPSYSDADIQQINELIYLLNLEQSGGSDYHGAYRPDVELGD